MRLVGPLVAGLLLLAKPAGAADKQIRPLIALSFGGSTTYVDFENGVGERHGIIGIQAAVLGDVVGIEMDVARTSGLFQREPGLGQSPLVLRSSAVTTTGNVVVAAPRRLTEYTLRPYFVAGLGVIRVSVDTPFGALPIRDTAGIYNLGGGVIGFLTTRVGVAWEVRRFNTLKGVPPPTVVTTGGRLAFWRASMALVIRY